MTWAHQGEQLCPGLTEACSRALRILRAESVTSRPAGEICMGERGGWSDDPGRPLPLPRFAMWYGVDPACHCLRSALPRGSGLCRVRRSI